MTIRGVGSGSPKTESLKPGARKNAPAVESSPNTFAVEITAAQMAQAIAAGAAADQANADAQDGGTPLGGVAAISEIAAAANELLP
jgi:hypothetical protein